MKSNVVLAALLSAVLLWTVSVSRVDSAPGFYRPAPPPPKPAETPYFQSLPQHEKDRALRARKRMEGITEHVKRDVKGLAL